MAEAPGSVNNLVEGHVFLSPSQTNQLERQGCSAENWSLVSIHPSLNLAKIRNVHFGGRVLIDEGASVRNGPGGLFNVRIGRNAIVENVARIEFEPEAPCGVGIQIGTLDETGSRPVTAYPGLSSQIATLMARNPEWAEKNLTHTLPYFLELKASPHEIGDNAIVRDSGRLLNVSVGKNAVIQGASYLKNGTVINNTSGSRSLTFIGAGVNAENFILEDGRLDSSAVVRNCYIGQGAFLEKGFTAHDSVFFANCTLENGEACALLAGPYTVSMHKASLLIGCQTSFMNAGSATNQSNHMYKLGPVHWGILERGVKTSSFAYVMLGAKIGAFSMVMGQHKKHPDTSDFPFSYLFGDQFGHTTLIPAVMLRSCGLMRDEKKWPTRDRRIRRKLPKHDRVTFNVLNPFTVDAILSAISRIDNLLGSWPEGKESTETGGMTISLKAALRARELYELAVFKYLSLTLPEGRFPEKSDKAPGEWLDVGGQVMRRRDFDKALATDSIAEAEEIFSLAFQNYERYQLNWIARRFDDSWRSRETEITGMAARFDEMVDDDREEYLSLLDRETQMLQL